LISASPSIFSVVHLYVKEGAYEKVGRIDMTLANEDVKMLHYSSAEITPPFLLPEMVCPIFILFVGNKLSWNQVGLCSNMAEEMAL
jgi:hypothetical protein